MAHVYYGTERSKYGVFAGCVVPFPKYLPGSNPGSLAFKESVPAGFLKANGGIYRGRDYPVLAEMFGMGANSTYRKPHVELEEPNADLTLGQFQVPDLGSKYINAATFSGGHNNLYVESANVPTATSGAVVELSLNQGENVQIFYEGNFQVGNYPVPMPSSMNFVSTLSTIVPEVSVDGTGFLPHAHFSTTTVIIGGRAPLGPAVTSAGGTTPAQGGNPTPRAVAVEPTGTAEGTNHVHNLDSGALDRDTEFFLPAFALDSAFLTTTVSMRADNTVKMDDLQHKYILVEYLIKF